MTARDVLAAGLTCGIIGWMLLMYRDTVTTPAWRLSLGRWVRLALIFGIALTVIGMVTGGAP